MRRYLVTMEDNDVLEQVGRTYCALKIIKTCLDILAHNTNETLRQKGKDYYTGVMKMEHDVMSHEYYSEANNENWPSDVKVMMSLSASVHFLKEYVEGNAPVDTISIRIGDEVLARVIIPYGGPEPSLLNL